MLELVTSTQTIETTRLQELEKIVETGLQTFVEVGQALMEIRDSQLYLETHRTFEEYVRARWGWARRTAYQYIERDFVAGSE